MKLSLFIAFLLDGFTVARRHECKNVHTYGPLTPNEKNSTLTWFNFCNKPSKYPLVKHCAFKMFTHFKY